MTKTNKKQSSVFERTFYSFYAFAYLISLFTIGFFYFNRQDLQKVNKNELQINVINPSDLDEVDTLNGESVENFILQNTTPTNPNIIDTDLSKKVLERLGKKQTLEHTIIINKDGTLSTDFVQITTGDYVTFYNATASAIDIKGDSGWGITGVKPLSYFTQIFYPSKKFSFTVLPFGSTGTIEVATP